MRTKSGGRRPARHRREAAFVMQPQSWTAAQHAGRDKALLGLAFRLEVLMRHLELPELPVRLILGDAVGFLELAR